MSDSLVKPITLGVQKVGIHGARAEAKRQIANIDPTTCANRFAIGFDDSGSMAGETIRDAHKAVGAFLNHCNPAETSVAIYPFNAEKKALSCDYTLITMYVNGIEATGGTPLYETMVLILQESITRGILFSDGQPDHSCKDQAISKAKEKKVPFDTVYIGLGDSAELKYIAEATGGIYLRFSDASIFAKQMKYLSPKYVALLANPEIKARIERGESI